MLFFIYKKRKWITIIEISEVLKSTRESSGLSLSEVSKDLNIDELILTQVEEGNIGAFKDLFELKKILTEYSKYLGLNPVEVIDEFNEYVFEMVDEYFVYEYDTDIYDKSNKGYSSSNFMSSLVNGSMLDIENKRKILENINKNRIKQRIK